MKKNCLFSSNLYFAILCTFVFAILVIKNVFVLTAPSDPLQYVKPALDSRLTFEFFDRVLLWIILKFFSQFITSAHLITGVTHLFITSFTLFICTLWLGNNFGRLSSSVFVFLYILSPVVFGISTYTYPTQLLTLIIIITIITLVNNNSSKRNLYTGLGAVFAFFSKVQSYSFIIFLFFYSFYKNKKFSDFVYLIFGIACGLLIIVFIYLYYTDIYRLLDLIQIYFFENSGSVQFYGRGEKTIPPFHKYLAEPTILLSIIGMIIPFYYKDLKTLRLFSIVAMVQFLGLFLIYLITKRGGPLIPNYIYDTYILGIICFSGFMFNFSKNKKFDNIIGYFLLLLSVIIIELFSNFNFFTTQQYDPRLLLNWKDISNLNLSYNFFETVIPGIFTWLALILFFTCSMFRLKVKYSDKIIITSAALLIIAISLRGGVALEDGKYRKNSALTYHIAAKEIENFNDGSLWVNVELNRNDLKDATLRLKRIFNTFYYSDEDKFFNEKYYFGQNEKLGLLKEYLLTDNVELIHKYLPSQTKEVIKFNSLTDKKPTFASQMNNVQNYPYRLNGIRGEALIYSENDELIVDPVSKGKENTFELMINFASSEIINKDENYYYFLSSKKFFFDNKSLISLYINYEKNGKWFSKKKLLDNEKDSVAFKFFIPKNTKSISYGWYITQKETFSKIILPQILLSKTKVSSEVNHGISIFQIKKNTFKKTDLNKNIFD